MLKTRALVAVIALPILLAVALIGGVVFAVIVGLALLIGGDEFVRLMRQGHFNPPEWLVLALIALPVASRWFEEPQWREPGMILLLIAGVFYAIWGMERGQAQSVINVMLAVFGGLYIGWLGSMLLAVRLLEDGAYLVIVLYGCVAFSDSAAYFVGRQWGRHKLTPRVSPKKTWEGYAGSVVGGLAFGAVAGGLLAADTLGWGHGAAVGVLIGAVGTVGDLAISVIKRQVGAKDSGHLIPGHGGMLDRLDSVLVAFAVGYYYLIWFVM